MNVTTAQNHTRLVTVPGIRVMQIYIRYMHSAFEDTFPMLDGVYNRSANISRLSSSSSVEA